MVKVYRRDDCQQGRGDDVGAVEQTAQTCLQHNNVASVLNKVKKSDSLRYLELRKIVLFGQLVNSLADFFGDLRKLAVGNITPVDAYAVVVAQNERRGETACFQTCRNEDAVKHLSDRAFAVRACDVNERKLVLWVTESGEQAPDPAEILYRLSRMCERIDKINT